MRHRLNESDELGGTLGGTQDIFIVTYFSSNPRDLKLQNV